MGNSAIKQATSEADIIRCWDVIKELRPHLQQSSFVQLVRELMNEGYQLDYIEEEGKAVSAIGYRYVQYLFNGRQFYIDDLSTLPDYRGKGYGGRLLEHVFKLAQKKGYKYVSLDSGYQRHDAHRLYLDKGFILASHHFIKIL